MGRKSGRTRGGCLRPGKCAKWGNRGGERQLAGAGREDKDAGADSELKCDGERASEVPPDDTSES